MQNNFQSNRFDRKKKSVKNVFKHSLFFSLSLLGVKQFRCWIDDENVEALM